MRFENRSLFFTLFFSLLIAGFSARAQTLNTTTTLAAETGNNTSAANSFAAQTNGNIGASNISKVPLDSLLYPGSNTLLWAHFMAWFGSPGHINVGYTSSDPTQVHNQVTDAMSRGLSAFLEDWYGSSKTVENDTALALKSEAESRGGQFSFGIVYDGGALSTCASTAGCDLTQQAINDLTYAYNTFETSPAYVRLNGRPVVMFFNPDRYSTLNWSLIASSVAGNPLFIFENSNGFTHASSSGGFAWVLIDTSNANDWEQSYLDSFFTTAQSYPAEYGWAAAYKGFNDTLAGWGTSRIMNQNCGQTWLDTFNEANQYWSSGKQLEGLQLVTWNDYEEGSELESGIDNCVQIAATVSGTSLSWSLTSGAESTIDHYTVFVSTDGQNLMSLGNVPAGTHTFDLSGTNLTAGNYSLFVKGVGRPLLTNKMSAAVLYNPSDSSSSGSGSTGSNGSSGSTGSSGTSGGTSASPDIALALNPASVTVTQGQAASVGLSVTPVSGFQGAVSFTCSNLPANAQCSFAPASLNVSSSAATTTISISTGTSTIGGLRRNPDIPMLRWFGFSSPAFGLAGLVLTGRKRRKTILATTAACVLTLAAMAACGGTGQNPSSVTPPVTPPTSTGQSANMTPRGNYQIAVTVTSGSISHATNVSLVVQ